MCDFKPGDEVVCVDSDGAPELVKSAPYIIRSVVVRGLGVTVFGAHPGGHYLGYRAGRFRKVERKTDKRSLTEWLSQPTDFEEPKRAPAKKRESA